ncbi:MULTISPECIES: response regulator transcription factor [unclassified Kitasatospora]|uniref:helix-turn-helix transcriptional regulator n=1 Tax=unclassified Kitasatospora TaxID=2633591 RepID=UPI00381C3D06
MPFRAPAARLRRPAGGRRRSGDGVRLRRPAPGHLAAAAASATSVTSATPAAPAAELTGQELRVARLAATGLSNKEIGHALRLSPRTVAAHLYKIIPKLGITSRAASCSARALRLCRERTIAPAPRTGSQMT